MRKNLLLLFFILSSFCSFSQKWEFTINVNNQPNNNLILGSLEGDQFSVLDSIKHINGLAHLNDNLDSNFGVYRLILGQTPIAKIMNEPPQQLDFIYNGEDIELETDFNSPLDSIKVINSIENKIWFDFLKYEVNYKKQIRELVIQINFFQNNESDTYYTTERKCEIINRYNSLQKDKEKYITSVENKYPQLFATKMIRFKREPFLDGNWIEGERNRIFKVCFWDGLDFTDEALINSESYTEKIFKYLMSYASTGLNKDEQIQEFTKAIDIILEKTSANANVSTLIVDYLLRGFEKLGLDQLQAYISDVYSVPHGCSGNINTLNRRLAFQQMKVGDTVPDFILTDINNNSYSLYQTNTDYKLILFWESDCPLCKELIPRLNQWYLSKEIDLEVFAISIQSNVDEWKDYLKQSNPQWINLIEPKHWDGKVALEYNLYATPTMFLVDNENKIIAKPIDFNGFIEAVARFYINLNLNK